MRDSKPAWKNKMESKIKNKIRGKLTCNNCSQKDYPIKSIDGKAFCSKCETDFKGNQIVFRTIRLLVYSIIILGIGLIIGPLSDPDGQSPFGLLALLLILDGGLFFIKSIFLTIKTLSNDSFLHKIKLSNLYI